MRGFVAEFGVLALAIISVAIALVPNVRSSSRAVLALSGVVAVILTIIQYFLLAYTGKGLFERAACLVFSAGPYCQQASVERPNDISAKAIWRPSREQDMQIQECLERSRGSTGCVVTTMSLASAPVDAMKFSRLLEGDAYMEAFYEFGRVDVAYAFFVFRANTNGGHLLVNGRVDGKPSIVFVDGFVWREEIANSPGIVRLRETHPEATAWPEGEFIKATDLENGGQRFLFRFKVTTQCRVCDVIGMAEVAYDFGSDGRFIRASVTDIQPPDKRSQ